MNKFVFFTLAKLAISHLFVCVCLQMYGAQQALSVGQMPSGISAEVGPVAPPGTTQLPTGYYTQPQQYAPNSRSVILCCNLADC